MRKFIFLFCLHFTAFFGFSQELAVRSLRVASSDLSARVESRKDANGVACALVKVQMLIPNAVFEGNVVGPCEYRVNEYWVYLTHGSKILRIKHPNFLTQEVHFSEYLIDKVESRVTYSMIISLPEDNPTLLGSHKEENVAQTSVSVSPIKVQPEASPVVNTTLVEETQKVETNTDPLFDSIPEPVPMNLPPLQMKKEVFKVMHKANTYSNKGQWEDAISIYAALAHYFPGYAMLQLRIAETYENKYKAQVDPMLSLNGAIQAYERYIELETNMKKANSVAEHLKQLKKEKRL